MKKLIIGILTVFCLIGAVRPSYAGIFAPMPQDFALHFIVGVTGQAILDNLRLDQTEENMNIMRSIAVIKEIYDVANGGYFDLIDCGMTWLGASLMEQYDRDMNKKVGNAQKR